MPSQGSRSGFFWHTGRRKGCTVAGLLALGLGSFACASTLWDVEALPIDRAERQALAGLDGQRLGDSTPYVFATLGDAVFFLCRWPSSEKIPLVLPGVSDPALAEAIEAAVDSVEKMLPIEFDRREHLGEGGIEIRRLEPGEPGVSGVANTVANCRLDPKVGDEGPRVDARLVDASIWLRVRAFDVAGRISTHSPAEVAGSLFHELGHALGFQGHVRLGRSVMVRSVDHVRRIGRRLLEGKTVDAPSLKALYAVPSGTVVARRQVGDEATRWFDAMSALVLRKRLRGPMIRVGDHVARVNWMDANGGSYPVFLHDVAAVMEGSRGFELDPARRTRALVARAGEPPDLN
ncbi:hypothetical protein MK489_09055 [Myxococcota bacterium]|nr:hypothetical protein [Myxococcota bacterium]